MGTGAITEANAATETYTTQYTYDGLGRLLTSTEARSDLTTHPELVTINTYFDQSNTVRTELANGLVTTSVYNGRGTLLSVQQSDDQTADLGSMMMQRAWSRPLMPMAAS